VTTWLMGSRDSGGNFFIVKLLNQRSRKAAFACLDRVRSAKTGRWGCSDWGRLSGEKGGYKFMDGDGSCGKCPMLLSDDSKGRKMS
jgi:hypothetical protein